MNIQSTIQSFKEFEIELLDLAILFAETDEERQLALAALDDHIHSDCPSAETN